MDGVDATDEDVEHAVAQLVVGEALALGLGGDEIGDEVSAGSWRRAAIQLGRPRR